MAAKVLVIDGQGGGLGRQLVSALAAACPEAELTAVGTNSLAANAMLKAGASRAATGENAVVVNCRRADIIVGPIGIVIEGARAHQPLRELCGRCAGSACQPARGGCGPESEGTLFRDRLSGLFSDFLKQGRPHVKIRAEKLWRKCG